MLKKIKVRKCLKITLHMGQFGDLNNAVAFRAEYFFSRVRGYSWMLGPLRNVRYKPN